MTKHQWKQHRKEIRDRFRLPVRSLQVVSSVENTLQGFWWFEVHVLRLQIRFVRQQLSCVHSFENLPVRGGQWDHVEVNWIQYLFQGYPRLVTSIPFLLKPWLKTTHINPLVSYRKHLIRDFGVSRFIRLRIRFVRQDLTSVISDGFGSSFLNWVCVFNDSHRSILHTFLFVSFD